MSEIKSKEEIEKGYKNKPEYLYRFEPVTKYSVLSLLTKHIYFRVKDDINDPNEFILQWDTSGINLDRGTKAGYFFNQLIKKLSKIGIYSLSLHPHDPLMWSHYADGYKGFCLQYEFNELNNLEDSNLIQIKYKKEKSIFKEKTFDQSKILKYSLEEKLAYWEYENEWRLIRYDQDISSVRYLDAPKIKGIIWGQNASRMEVEKISRTLQMNDMYPDIEFYRADINDTGKITINGPFTKLRTFVGHFHK